jgi:hypothetical protein
VSDDETPELDPAILALLGDPRAAQMIGLPKLEETKIEPRQDGDDYVTSRDAMHKVLGKTLTAIDEMSQLAWQGQHPRAYEVLANLLKTAADVNKDLLALKEKDQKMKAPEQENAPKNVTYNDNRTVVTSEELLKMTRERARVIRQIDHDDDSDEHDVD